MINGGNPGGLFQAAFMVCRRVLKFTLTSYRPPQESGSPVPLTTIDTSQPAYDLVVSLTGCSDASDTLACLTTVPYETLYNAVQNTPSVQSYFSLNVSLAKEHFGLIILTINWQLFWGPVIDGSFITEDPTISVANGNYAKVANIRLV